MKCPCKVCPRKGCGSYHSKCKDYLEWKAELDEKNKAERTEKISHDVMSDAQKRHCWIKKRYSKNQPISRSTKER